ncbi:hypothetical protein R1sor_015407 [Riccia sorocarpa]|uniref:Uncharacterized protein n=1 Tax=Riccia sorocarpa TaxID=122646 RepID=A0ABD3HCH2_9MARC
MEWEVTVPIRGAEVDEPVGDGGETSTQATRRGTSKKKTRAPAQREGQRLQWTPEMVVHLLELNKIEWHDGETLYGRDVIVTADQKLKKLQAGLAAKVLHSHGLEVPCTPEDEANIIETDDGDANGRRLNSGVKRTTAPKTTQQILSDCMAEI